MSTNVAVVSQRGKDAAQHVQATVITIALFKSGQVSETRSEASTPVWSVCCRDVLAAMSGQGHGKQSLNPRSKQMRNMSVRAARERVQMPPLRSIPTQRSAIRATPGWRAAA